MNAVLKPMSWAAHVQCQVPGEDGTQPYTATIEILVNAVTKEEAQQAANQKVLGLGYKPWSVRCIPQPGLEGLPGVSSLVPALPAPALKPDIKPDILDDKSVFWSYHRRPTYGKEVAHDSLP